MSKSHEFAEALTEKLAGKNNYAEKYVVMEGRKYDRIVSVSSNGSRSVFAFVERGTNNLLKAATWKAPAEGVRYAGEDLLTKAVEDADFASGFLYKR